MVPGQRISELKRHTRLGLSVAISALVLTGCVNPFGQQGYLRDRAGDYTEAQIATPITLPAGSQAKELGDVLVIPEAGASDQKLSRAFEVPRPSQRLMMKEGDHYSVERNEAKSSVSLQDQGLDIALLAQPGRDGNGNPVLTVRGLSYARVWDAVAIAMDKAGLKVVDRNRSAGLFYLADSVPQLNREQKKKSFWSGWFSGDEEAVVPDENKTLTVRVSNYPEVVQLSVEKDVNTSAPADVSQKLLRVIQNNLQ